MNDFKLKVTKEDLGDCRVKLAVVVDPETVEAEYGRVMVEVAKEAKHPGFRKGKVPLKIVEEKYAETINEETLSQLLTKGVSKAIVDEDLTPMTRPRLENEVKFERGKELAFEAFFDVRPEITLKTYTGLKAKKPAVAVSDEDVEKTLSDLREHHAQFVPVEDRPARMNDTVVINFEGFMDGEPIEGGKAENYSLLLGGGRFIPGFEENVVGMSTGDEKEFEVTFPEDYHAETLKGKPVLFKISLSSIKERQLCDLDDEFAKDVSEFETLEELRADIRKELERVHEKKAMDEVKDQVAEAVIEEHKTITPPAVMVEEEITRRMAQLERNLQMSGRTMESFLEQENKTREDLREEIREAAKKTVIYHLVSDAVCKKEQLDPTEDEIQSEIAKLAGQSRMEPAQYRQFLEQHQRLEMVRDQVRFEKTMNFLVAKADIVSE